MTAAARKDGPRKGATRAADIPTDVLQALSRGEMPSATLAECMALDQGALMRAVFPGLSAPALKAVDAACTLLLDELGTDGIVQCQARAADTVRGWACFMVGAQPDLDLSVRLDAIRPLADDMHFGVREWAWMAVRPHLARELEVSIAHLAQWTAEPSERLRRFASEALRPRGVWCAHIGALKREPELALPILSPLRTDPSAYVQDSVANWLNDVAKDQPDWVRNLCAQWLEREPGDATRRICQRAQRSLK